MFSFVKCIIFVVILTNLNVYCDQRKCQMVPIDDKSGLSGYCCILKNSEHFVPSDDIQRTLIEKIKESENNGKNKTIKVEESMVVISESNGTTEKIKTTILSERNQNTSDEESFIFPKDIYDPPNDKPVDDPDKIIFPKPCNKTKNECKRRHSINDKPIAPVSNQTQLIQDSKPVDETDKVIVPKPCNKSKNECNRPSSINDKPIATVSNQTQLIQDGGRSNKTNEASKISPTPTQTEVDLNNRQALTVPDVRCPDGQQLDVAGNCVSPF